MDIWLLSKWTEICRVFYPFWRLKYVHILSHFKPAPSVIFLKIICRYQTANLPVQCVRQGHTGVFISYLVPDIKSVWKKSKRVEISHFKILLWKRQQFREDFILEELETENDWTWHARSDTYQVGWRHFVPKLLSIEIYRSNKVIFLLRDAVGMIEHQLKVEINQQILLVQHLHETLRIEQTKLGTMLRESMINILNLKI